jgi:hypothetical protein
VRSSEPPPRPPADNLRRGRRASWSRRMIARCMGVERLRTRRHDTAVIAERMDQHDRLGRIVGLPYTIALNRRLWIHDRSHAPRRSARIIDTGFAETIEVCQATPCASGRDGSTLLQQVGFTLRAGSNG